MSPRRHAARAAVALGVGVAVAACAYDPRAPAADPKRLVALAVGVAALAMALARGAAPRAGRGAPHAVWYAAGFVAWSGVTLAWGLQGGALDLASWVAGVLVAIAAASLGPRSAALAARWAGLLAGAGASVVCLAQWGTGQRGLALHGGQGNPNWLGLLLAVCLPLSLDLALRARRAGSPLFPAVACGVAVELPALLLSHSRVAWLATALGLAFAFARRPARPLATVAALLVLSTLTIGRAQAGGDADVEDAPASVSLSGRIWIAGSSARAALAALPFGAGLGRFGHAYLDAQGEQLRPLPPREASRRFSNATTAHDEWLQVAVESGPLATLLLAAAFASTIAAHRRAGSRAAAGALVACAVSACGDSPLRQPAIVLVVALIVAAAPGHRIAGPGAGRLARVAAVVAIASAAWLGVASVRAWAGARLATAASGAEPVARLALLARATRVDPGSGERALELGLLRLSADDPEGALGPLLRSRELLANVGTDVAIGNAELALGRTDDAIASFRAAAARSPGSLRAHANLAEALRRAGRFEQAERELALARLVSPGLPKLRELADRIAEDRIRSEAEGERPAP